MKEFESVRDMTLPQRRDIAVDYPKRNPAAGQTATSLAAHSPRTRSNTRMSPNRGLDATDYKILNCLSDGMSNAAIADHLHYAQSTIKNRISRLFRQFDVESRTALISVWLTHPHNSAAQLGHD